MVAPTSKTLSLPSSRTNKVNPMKRQRSFVIPDWVDLLIGAILAFFLGLWMIGGNMHPVLALLGAIVLYFLIYYTLGLMFEEPRSFEKAYALEATIRSYLARLNKVAASPYIKRHNQTTADELIAGISNAYAIIDTVTGEWISATQMYGGLFKLKITVERALRAEVFERILENRRIAGDKAAEKIAEGEVGIAGFDLETAEMLVNVNAGKIFDYTVNFRILGALALVGKLFGKNPKEAK